MTVPVFDSGGVRVFHGDCIEVMREMPAESVHAVVTDPPYGISFMGKAWDQPGEFGSTRKNGTPSPHRRERPISNGSMAAGLYDLSPAALVNFQRWCEAWARECFRLLKPGGHLLSFGGSRTWHRLASGIEDAGFEMRDSIAWLYGSGFPKSLNVSVAIDKAAGVEREVLSEGRAVKRMIPGADQNATGSWIKDNGREFVPTVTAPATAEAAAWDGWGTALKPSFEPVVVARKPLRGTVAQNVLAYGTGALNIDATRTAVLDAAYERNQSGLRGHAGTRPPEQDGSTDISAGGGSGSDKGRWPSNVLLDASQAADLDKQSGVLTSGVLTSGANPSVRGSDKFRTAYGEFAGQRVENPARGADSGGASRFFPTFHYEAKAPTSERPQDGETSHPTVKPLDLMRWLVRLVTPPGGVVLEPFAGSGTTLEACVREGFEAIGIEREADYLPLIVKRLSKDHQQSLFGDWDGAT